MSLQLQLPEYVAAGFSGLWIVSHEPEDALAEIARLCRERMWNLATWDVDRGMSISTGDVNSTASSDPLSAVRAASNLAGPERNGLLVLKNFHRLLGSLEIVQALAHQLEEGKRTGNFIVVLAPVVQIPTELEKQFVVIEHQLPDRNQLSFSTL